MIAPPRTREQRIQDTLRRLEQDIDCWVATADGASGTPYLVPLSYLREGATLLIATPATSATSRNLQATGKVRLGLGPTRDVVLIEGTAQPLAISDIPSALGDAFAEKTGFDPRELSTPYLFFRITPVRIQAWREANELEGRLLMRGGEWLMPGQDLTD